MEKENLKERLLLKCQEAFIMGLELYNKPTIKYRIEGFSFFICNAWELMLKAKLLKDNISIYYSDNPNRTLNLSDVIKIVYTDKNQPLRINLEKIIDLRNISTHLVTEDYETVYAPFFQANILNFSEQLQKFHDIDITRKIPQNFLSLSVNMDILNNDEIRGKYSPAIAEKLITQKNDLEVAQETNSSNSLVIPLQNTIMITKNPKNADFSVNVSSDSDNNATILKELKDPNDKYKLSFNNVIKGVNKQLKAKNLKFNYYDKANDKNEFNQYTLSLIIKFYNLKNDDKYAYHFANVTRYSQQIVEFIVKEIKNDPNVIDNIKKANKKR
ncbi:DUF3644 domain-containing protein [Staphylococcus hominis]|uniref:DUF3644 domain-containing protein n=1 Tax=Staphylococcus hominis TaxID=1290 RepID=A0A974QPJ1_STAHO|nr:DUF3644 domain-containing protein [Staphylococcus hominis]PTK32250.1 DUF3644 domain-containing protein [Staphylococcus hominis]